MEFTGAALYEHSLTGCLGILAHKVSPVAHGNATDMVHKNTLGMNPEHSSQGVRVS